MVGLSQEVKLDSMGELLPLDRALEREVEVVQRLDLREPGRTRRPPASLPCRPGPAGSCATSRSGRSPLSGSSWLEGPRRQELGKDHGQVILQIVIPPASPSRCGSWSTTVADTFGSIFSIAGI